MCPAYRYAREITMGLPGNISRLEKPANVAAEDSGALRDHERQQE
jgi:hypothetical protein